MLSGHIEKMASELTAPVQYHLPIGDDSLPMNPFLDRTLTLSHNGVIHCIACGAKTKKASLKGIVTAAVLA